MSGLAQISATDWPSAMRAQNRSAHSRLNFVGLPILAGTRVDRLLVRAGMLPNLFLAGRARLHTRTSERMSRSAMSLAPFPFRSRHVRPDSADADPWA